MRFSGQFAESLLTEQLDRVSLSFLVEDLQIRRGGIAPNICFGLAALGLDPLLGSVGEDFGDYRAWLERHGVQTWAVRVSETKHTARFICTTDSVNAQSAPSTPVRWPRRAKSSCSRLPSGPAASIWW